MGVASSLPLSDEPARDCKLTMEELREDLLEFTDFCPSCERRDVRCRVGNHPSRTTPASAPAAPGEFMLSR
jgi:hypothetical protein